MKSQCTLTDGMGRKFRHVEGLRGPYKFIDCVLYFDEKENQYYDSVSDFYVSEEEMNALHARLISIISGKGDHGTTS